MTVIHIDFETYSEAGYVYDVHTRRWKSAARNKSGIGLVGAAAYAFHPSTTVLSLAYNETLWLPGQPYPDDLLEHVRNGGIISAHNVEFEYYIWNIVCRRLFNWPLLHIDQLQCTAARAAEHNLPTKLAHLSNIKQDSRIVQKVCVPGRNPKPEDYQQLYSYNLDDVRAERTLPACSSELFKTHMRINTRGVQIDRELLYRMIRHNKAREEVLTQELRELTGRSDITGDKVEQLKEITGIDDFNADNLRKLDINDPVIQRIVDIRLELGSKTVKKLYAMHHALCPDGRLRGLFRYRGASQTGRFSGTLVQPQNLKRTSYDEELLQRVMQSEPDGTITNDELSSLIRALFVAAPGKQLVCSDYSAIEAVVLAMISGEQWRIDVFRTHGKIYEASAATITGKNLDEITPELRQLGKVAELASGYQGALNAWKNFGADKFMNDEQIINAVKAWRAASPNIVALWYRLEREAIQAVCNPNTQFGQYYYDPSQQVLLCALPSGRQLYYWHPHMRDDQLAYWRWRGNSWELEYLYGGLLTENQVQAISCDILCHALVNCERNGYPVVLHVHDEIVAEVEPGSSSVEGLEQIMNDLPTWAKDWPVKAKGGWIGTRYKK